jgi:outer membrane usher protein
MAGTALVLGLACSSALAQATAPQQATAQPNPAVEGVRLNPTGKDIPLSAPLRESAFILGEIDFVLKADDSVTVNATRLLALLQPLLNPERYSELENGLRGATQIDVQRITELGFPLRYDPETIGLVVDVPAAARTTRQLQLQQLGNELIGEVDKPAGLSGYINFRSSTDYVWQGPDKGIQDPLILLDSAINYRGFVLENEGTLQFGDGGRGLVREGTRVVYDDQKRLARWTAGDLQPVARGFSGAPQLAGLSIVRSYSVLEPQRNVQPRGERSFTVSRPSVVEAFINGQPIRRIRLEPGTYNVRDFPFAQGANDIRLVIEDDAGGREVIEFSLFFDRTLLAPGLTEFGVFAGILAPFTGGARDYRFDQPGVSGFIRRGLSDRLTAGANFQAQRRGAVIGAEAVAATAIGTLGGDVAFSQVRGIGFGYAVNIGLQRTFGGSGSRGRAIAITAEHRSENFATPNEIIPDNRFVFDLGATYSQSLGELQFVSVNGQYSKGRGAFQDEKTARVTYGYRISERLNLAVEGVYEDRASFGTEYGVRVGLIFRLDPRSSAVVEYDSRNSRGRLGYQTSRGDGVGAWSASADVDYGRGAAGLDGAVTYTANRAELGVSHTTVFDVSGTNITDQRSSLRVGTAIAFANGSFALSRPIFDSFAMVKPHRSIAGKTVLIDPREGNYTARSGFFGPAVEPDLSSYSDRVVSFDVLDAPLGYDLGTGNVRVYPPYRSGYLVTAGSDYSVTAVGTMVDQNGEPVSLLAGRAYEVDKPDNPPVTVFTNRSGRFGIQGLRPGQWRIEMPTQPPGEAIITVPSAEKGVVRVDVKLGDAK